MGTQIRKDIKKAREKQRLEELKEKLWIDIKHIRKGYQLNNTKIRNAEGKVVPSTKKSRNDS